MRQAVGGLRLCGEPSRTDSLFAFASLVEAVSVEGRRMLQIHPPHPKPKTTAVRAMHQEVKPVDPSGVKMDGGPVAALLVEESTGKREQDTGDEEGRDRPNPVEMILQMKTMSATVSEILKHQSMTLCSMEGCFLAFWIL